MGAARVTTVVNGRTQAATELYQTPISWTAGYDSRNRLTSFARAGAETKYSYDANSNRLTAIDITSSEIDLEGAFDQPNFIQSASQSLNIDPASNRLLGFTQTLTKTQAGGTVSSVTSPGELQHRCQRRDDQRWPAHLRLRRIEAPVQGQDRQGRRSRRRRIPAQRPRSARLQERAAGRADPAQGGRPGAGVHELAQEAVRLDVHQGNGSKSRVGTAFIYGDGEIPQWALLGEYDNGSAMGKGRTEYIWLPTEDGNAIPIGMYRNGKFFAIHTDHLGTPRLMTDQDKKPVWQWPYSAFGNNKPTGPLLATTTNGQTTLKATKPAAENNLRNPGQYFDSETGLNQNVHREYTPGLGVIGSSIPWA